MTVKVTVTLNVLAPSRYCDLVVESGDPARMPPRVERERWGSPVATPETPKNFVRGGSDPPHGPAVMALLPLGRRHNNTENHSRIRLIVQHRAKNADDLQIKDRNYTNSTHILL